MNVRTLRKNAKIILNLLLIGSASAASASTLYWGQNTYSSGTTYNGNFGTAGNWFTDASGSTVSGAAPVSTDDVIFNTTPNSTVGGTVLVTGNIAVNSFAFSTSGNTAVGQSGGNRTLTLGTGGITVNSGSGSVTFGGSTNTLFVEMLGSQTWTNQDDSILTVRNLRTSNSASGVSTLTLNAASSGAISYVFGLADSADTLKATALVVDSAGSGVVNIVSSTYTGGTTLKRGILSINTLSGTTYTIGTGTVKLGDVSGSASATLRLNAGTNTVNNNIVVQAGNTGTNTLEFNSAGNSSLTGTLQLANNLNVGVRNGAIKTIGSVISGTGNLVKTQYQGGASGELVLAGINSYSGNTTVGNGILTLADDARLTFYIGANGVNNRMNGTGILNLNGDFVFDLSSAVGINGNSWSIVDVAGLTETFGSTFSVQGFSEASNIWTSGNYSFSEATGILSYTAVPEPSTAILLVFGIAAWILRRPRRPFCPCGSQFP